MSMIGLVAVLALGGGACAPARAGHVRQADLEANRALVRRFHAAIGSGDYAAADSLVAPGYRHHVVADTGFRAIDWAAFKAGNAGARQAFPDWTTTLDLIVAEGEYVVVLGTGHGTQRGDFAGVPATGHMVRVPLALIHQVRDGRIIADWEVANAEPALRALRASAQAEAPRD
jgi:predicted ester cyclase